MIKNALFRLPPPPRSSSFRTSSCRFAAIFSSGSESSFSCPITPTIKMHSGKYIFGPYKIFESEVFYSTNLSYAMVLSFSSAKFKRIFGSYLHESSSKSLIHVKCIKYNGCFQMYVLVCPRREVQRFVDLSTDETSDLWLTAQKVGGLLERYHKATSITFAIQDGPQAGQTVPHVHIHIIPRKGGDFEKNDEIYDAIDEKEKELKQHLDLDKERKNRSSGEMAEEADVYRKLFF